MKSQSVMGESKGSIKVLVLSRAYPNSVLGLQGLWVQRLVRHSTSLCTVKVVSPVPYCPALPGISEYYARFRRIETVRWDNGAEVFHPRFLVGFGYSLYDIEATTYYLGIRRQVNEIRRDFKFDLIHAHYVFPDGAAAVRLGRRYQVPVIITEQNLWRPWLDDYPLVRRQAVKAARQSVFQIAISKSVQETIVHFTSEPEKIRLIPDGVDGSAFTPLESGKKPNPNQILFVGFINYVKGIDVLLASMCTLIARRPDVRLVLAGGSHYRKKQQQDQQLRQMAHELGLDDHVQFIGTTELSDLVRLIGESAVLVLPSRAESFGSVLVEALACGTPVVATRCGGPEDIVNDSVGVLVPVEDPDALANGIEHVLTRRDDYDSAALRTYALEKFSWDSIARKVVDLYGEAIARFR